MFKIGYEFEFYSPYARKELREKIVNHFGYNLILSRPEATKAYDKWYLLKTPQLRGERDANGNGMVGHELVSPVMSLDEGREALFRFIAWCQELKDKIIFMPECILQVTLSYQERSKSRAINPLKLVMVLNEIENEILAHWHDRQNARCKSTYTRLINELYATNKNYFLNSRVKPTVSKADIRGILTTDAHNTIDFTKQHRKGCISFNMIGHKYITNPALAWEDILQLCNKMAQASDPAIEEAFTEWLKIIVTNTLNNINTELNRAVLNRRSEVEVVTRRVEQHRKQIQTRISKVAAESNKPEMPKNIVDVAQPNYQPQVVIGVRYV
jgi:hypothetical protein